MLVKVTTDFMVGIRNEVPFTLYHGNEVEMGDVEAGRHILIGNVMAIDEHGKRDAAAEKKAIAAAQKDGKPLGDPRAPLIPAGV